MSSTETATTAAGRLSPEPQDRPTVQSLAVTVLLGGPSSERQISLKSGRAVAEALESIGHDVIQADIGPDDLAALERQDLDVVFPALHGQFGEDGTVQEIMTQRGISYCGSGPQASRLAMDKIGSKWRFLQAGVPVADGGLIDKQGAGQLHRRLKDRLGLPVVVKPVDQGSSLEVVVAGDEKTCRQAIEHLLDRYGRCMLERFIPGREFTVGILADAPLPLVEIVTPSGLFDFASKYESQATQYLLDIDLPAETYRHLQQVGWQAHRVLGCRDFSRVDMRLDPNGRPFVLEVNTIPGFTSRSLLPMAAAQAGIEFSDLCDRLVRMARQRATGV